MRARESFLYESMTLRRLYRQCHLKPDCFERYRRINIARTPRAAAIHRAIVRIARRMEIAKANQRRQDALDIDAYLAVG